VTERLKDFCAVSIYGHRDSFIIKAFMHDALDQYIDTIDHLPPSPTVVVKLIALFRQTDPALDEIVSVMSLDPSLTAEVLKRCNSASYAGGENVLDVFEAIMRVGFYEVYQTAVAWFGQQAISQTSNSSGLDPESLWRHSAITAVAAGQVAQKLGEPAWAGFTAGLLHDIGKIALASAEGPKYAALTAQVGRCGIALEEGEKASFRFGHGEVGARLLHRWGVPPEIAMPVCFHHVSAWPEPYARSCAAVNLANVIAHSVEQNEAVTESDLEAAKPAMTGLGLILDDFIEIFNQTQTELAGLKGILSTLG
jgi:putative nucleotidyltransferase with HDIG domain